MFEAQKSSNMGTFKPRSSVNVNDCFFFFFFFFFFNFLPTKKTSFFLLVKKRFVSGHQTQKILVFLVTLVFKALFMKLFTVCAATKTGAGKLPKVHTRRKPKLAIWSLMVGSFSMFCCNFFTSQILTTREISVEYKLITCLPKAFPVFFTLLIQSTLLVFSISFVKGTSTDI